MTGKADQRLLEGSVKELGVTVGALDDLPEKSDVGLGRAVLLVLGLVDRGVKQRHGQMDGEELGVTVLLSQRHGILHGLLGPVGEIHSCGHDGSFVVPRGQLV